MNIHFVGIGGIGMSALARYYLSNDGVVVSGSDSTDSPLLEDLREEGAHIFIGHKIENVPKNTDKIVYTEAVAKDNPERSLGIKEQSYAEALGEITAKYKTIAVAGTHGKSTTSAMLALAIKNATAFIGTKIFEWEKKNFRKGDSEFLITEACEYRDSFLNLHPYIAVITSLEAEHLDFFGTEEKYFASFQEFVSKAKILVADFSNPNIQKISENFLGEKVDVSGLVKEVPKLQVIGDFNRQNASLVLGVFKSLNLDTNIAIEELKKFRGTWRRMEKKSENVYDDYAHHPTEISCTLNALRKEYPHKKIVCVFQPHQYSRTAEFLKEFGKSFSSVDEVLVPNIYRVRDSEEDVQRVSAEDLVQEIQKNGTEARHTRSFEKTLKIIFSERKKEDILITMGAGPVGEVANRYLAGKIC